MSRKWIIRGCIIFTGLLLHTAVEGGLLRVLSSFVCDTAACSSFSISITRPFSLIAEALLDDVEMTILAIPFLALATAGVCRFIYVNFSKPNTEEEQGRVDVG